MPAENRSPTPSVLLPRPRRQKPALLDACGRADGEVAANGLLDLGEGRIAFLYLAGRFASPEEGFMNNIIYIVGLIVIVLVILGFLGLR
ncbi:hypothetical protein HUS23_12070 [Ectothiorhodospiraceae bacterium 2226]|nr:hypothetical protein HUS23_12070 [Ectothiorhodospiraceae bacterium 2226]